jgi:DNA-binding MarR family transcriptional regulator
MANPLLELVAQVHLDWKRHVARALAPHGISPKQIFLLRKLQEAAVLTPSEVAVLLHADRPSTTSMLDTLERAGWIHRGRDPHNGKRVLVTLSGEGLAKLQSVPQELWRSGHLAIDPEACLEPGEQVELARLLRKLRDQIRALPEEG